jgi:mRNA interferase RelE/StbE
VSYRVTLLPGARRDLAGLPRHAQVRVAAKIDDLAADPRPPGVKKLSGEADLYRVRVGDYRIIYTIDDDSQSVQVVAVGDRKEIYRRGFP